MSETAFDAAVRALARRKGHAVFDREPVWSDLGQETMAWSDVTFEEVQYVEIRCGGYSERFEGPDALPQLWAVLNDEGPAQPEG